MKSQKARAKRIFVSGSAVAAFALMAVAVALHLGIIGGSVASPEGLSGLVSVRGAVSLEALNLSKQEVRAINTAVNGHRQTFTRIELNLNAKGNAQSVEPNTVLSWTMTLTTNGNCEVKSWERKVQRAVLVRQMVSYMDKAAREYTDFQRHPDIRKKFKTLYI